MQNKHHEKLEFDTILEMLAGHALSERAKARCRALAPEMNEAACRRRMRETTGARTILDACGSPPLTAMPGLEAILTLCKAGAMLVPDQLTQVERFLVACGRMQRYLAAAADTDAEISAWGGGLLTLPELAGEIDRCIRAGQVDSAASAALAAVRRRMEQVAGQVKAELAGLAQSKRQWLSDGGAVQRNGRYVLPVRREHKGKISGTVVDISATGSTVFIEPAAVARLQQQLAGLEVEEENEVRRVLYALSALVEEHAAALRADIEAMEALDFLFARAKLSAAMGAGPVALTAERRLALKGARHPLLPREGCVPLALALDGGTRGIIITGPNTGGKTVALKTVGLLSLMAQSGLHITAEADSLLCMQGAVLCDLGDGQSISENLSTFSSHMTAIIGILAAAGGESLVLLDELGSGTDPAEGMGLAVAVLEALRGSGCMLVATTHYPEVKQYAEGAEGYTNARMAFDRESLQPTYRLEVGLAGESCALYIARRLGLPEAVLAHATRQAALAGGGGGAEGGPVAVPAKGGEGGALAATYRGGTPAAQGKGPDGTDAGFVGTGAGTSGAGAGSTGADVARGAARRPAGAIQRAAEPKTVPAHAASFGFGDSVLVYPRRETGIVFHTAGATGEVGVQVRGEKRWVPHKRLKLLAKADRLYPPDYDFSVVFDTMANRKARKQMDKGRNLAGNVIHHDGFEVEEP